MTWISGASSLDCLAWGAVFAEIAVGNAPSVARLLRIAQAFLSRTADAGCPEQSLPPADRPWSGTAGRRPAYRKGYAGIRPQGREAASVRLQRRTARQCCPR